MDITEIKDGSKEKSSSINIVIHVDRTELDAALKSTEELSLKLEKLTQTMQDIKFYGGIDLSPEIK